MEEKGKIKQDSLPKGNKKVGFPTKGQDIFLGGQAASSQGHWLELLHPVILLALRDNASITGLNPKQDLTTDRVKCCPVFPLLCTVSSSQGRKEVGQVPRLPPCGTALGKSHRHGRPISNPSSPGADHCLPRAASGRSFVPSCPRAIPATAPSSPITSNKEALVSLSSHFSMSFCVPSMGGCLPPSTRSAPHTSSPHRPPLLALRSPLLPSRTFPLSPPSPCPRPSVFPASHPARPAQQQYSLLQSRKLGSIFCLHPFPSASSVGNAPLPSCCSAALQSHLCQSDTGTPDPMPARGMPTSPRLSSFLQLCTSPPQTWGGIQPAAHVTWQHRQPPLATGAQRPAERGRAAAGRPWAAGAQPGHSARGQSATACLIRHREKFNNLLSAFHREPARTAAPLPAPSLLLPRATAHARGQQRRTADSLGPWCQGAPTDLPPSSRCSLPIPTSTPASPRWRAKGLESDD